MSSNLNQALMEFEESHEQENGSHYEEVQTVASSDVEIIKNVYAW